MNAFKFPIGGLEADTSLELRVEENMFIQVSREIRSLWSIYECETAPSNVTNIQLIKP